MSDITLSVKKAVTYPLYDAKTKQVIDIPNDRFVEWPYSRSLVAAIEAGEVIREVRAEQIIEIKSAPVIQPTQTVVPVADSTRSRLPNKRPNTNETQ